MKANISFNKNCLDVRLDWTMLVETNIAQINSNMPTFIHNEKQPRAINLDYIDSINKENGVRFEIVFERVLFNGSSGGLAEVGRWQFETEKERDKVLKWILNSYGLGV